MKKLFAFFVLSVLVASSSFAQINLAYIVKNDATADQKIIDYLNDNGYTVNVIVTDGTVPEGDFELAVISDTNGSKDDVWAAFSDAPMPVVALSAFAAGRKLGWSEGSFGNTDKMSVTPVAPSHPIFEGIQNPTFHTDRVSTDWGDFATQWVTFPELPEGATVITTVTKHPDYEDHPDGDLPQIIAFESGTNVTEETSSINRGVIAGFHNGANEYLTNEGLQAIKQSCDWVVEATPSSIPSVVADNLLMKLGDALVNPTNLKVEIYNISGAKVLNSNESSINLSGLPGGLYIAKTNAGVLKFVK